MASPAATADKKTKGRSRKPTHYALVWCQETAPEINDETGAEIPGTERPCFVLMDLPPGLDEAQKRNRDAIERACKKAVYEKGLEEYGNKKLMVVSYGEPFDIPFEKTTVTKLLPPEKAARAKGKKDDATIPPVEGDGSDSSTGDEGSSKE